MTAKELAMMFLACKIPLADMEKMIEDYRRDELYKFRIYWNADCTYDRIIIIEEDVESYLNQAK